MELHGEQGTLRLRILSVSFYLFDYIKINSHFEGHQMKPMTLIDTISTCVMKTCAVTCTWQKNTSTRSRDRLLERAVPAPLRCQIVVIETTLRPAHVSPVFLER